MAIEPRAGKPVLLKCALDLLINKGYNAVNILAIAEEAGCSTQPISWHFKNMDGMKNALYDYGAEYAKDVLQIGADVPSAEKWERTLKLYIGLAYDKPNLFQFLYLGTYKPCECVLIELNKQGEYSQVLAQKHGISEEKAKTAIELIIACVHGIAALVVNKSISRTKEEAIAECSHITQILMKVLSE